MLLLGGWGWGGGWGLLPRVLTSNDCLPRSPNPPHSLTSHLQHKAPKSTPTGSWLLPSPPFRPPGCTHDRYRSLPPSPTSLTSDLLLLPLRSSRLSNPLFRLAPSHPVTLPLPCIVPPPVLLFPRPTLPRHPHPVHSPAPPPFAPSTQVNLAKCAAAASSRPAAGRWWWPSRR